MRRIDRICSIIFNFYESHTVGIYVRENDVLKCLSYSTLSESFLKEEPIPLEGTYPGIAFMHQKPLVISNFKEEDFWRLGYYKKKEEIKAFMAYPVQDIGVVCIDTKKRYQFTERETRCFSDFVPLIADVIKTEKIGEEVEEKVSELEWRKLISSIFGDVLRLGKSISELLKEVNRLCGADISFVGIERSDGLEVKEIVGNGLRERPTKLLGSKDSVSFMVVRTGRKLVLPYGSGYLENQPLLYDDEPHDFKQFFGFPLIFDDVAFGVVGFASRDKPMDVRSVGILEDLASMISLYYSCLLSKDCFSKVKDFDPVTGAYQFHAFLRKLDDLIGQSTKFGLIKITLRNLDVLNRKKGLEFTDGFLEKVFRLILNYLGQRSVISRKGSKFYAILLDRDRNYLVNLSKILKAALLKLNLEIGNWERKEEGVSVRFAVFPDDGTDLPYLLSKLD